MKKMVGLGMDPFFSFSLVPLYVAISVGVGFLFLALLEIIYVLSFWISGNTSRLAPGWSSLMFMLLLVGGSLMVFLGFLGIYVGYIFQEVKTPPDLYHPPPVGRYGARSGARATPAGGRRGA